MKIVLTCAKNYDKISTVKHTHLYIHTSIYTQRKGG